MTRGFLDALGAGPESYIDQCICPSTLYVINKNSFAAIELFAGNKKTAQKNKSSRPVLA